jgi:predicted O-linked N-acetylglucosamine transferase (SPINDLY family)
MSLGDEPILEAVALRDRARAALAQGRGDQAIADLERALVLKPDLAGALNDLGKALARQRRYEEAVACFDAVLLDDANSSDMLNERGKALWMLNRHDEAIASYGKAIAAGARDEALYHNRGIAWLALGLHQRAIDDFDGALAINPDCAEALRSRGHALTNLRRYDEAAASYVEAAVRNPDLPYVLGDATQSRAHICDWTDYDQTARRVLEGVRAGRRVCVPFAMLPLSQDAGAQLICAKSYASDNYSIAAFPDTRKGKRAHPRIRVAYLSADFHDHATSYLIAELLELHDRARFEVLAISFGPDSAGEMRSRVSAGADRMIDVRKLSDADVASLLRDMEIDIAVDLKGFTLDARPGILARRPAPIQVGYLGYPGTTGGEYLDYLIADHFVIPAGADQHYSERVVRLPDCYQVNDSKRRIADRMPNRSELGLPEQGLVFCSFNAGFKIMPSMFDVWMRLLRRVDGSVLWLLPGNEFAERNLRREAQARGIDPGRLVFAPRRPLSEHLARHRVADLFLDTLPCNAHTTASDALWAGLPVLTCSGESFASRVAGSLLLAVGLPELVTHSLADYESKALELAANPSMLSGLRKRLADNRLTAPLFRTDRFRTHLESAFATMWDIYERGDRPGAFAVERIEG